VSEQLLNDLAMDTLAEQVGCCRVAEIMGPYIRQTSGFERAILGVTNVPGIEWATSVLM
jgi:hypothetical protein